MTGAEQAPQERRRTQSNVEQFGKLTWSDQHRKEVQASGSYGWGCDWQPPKQHGTIAHRCKRDADWRLTQPEAENARHACDDHLKEMLTIMTGEDRGPVFTARAEED